MSPMSLPSNNGPCTKSSRGYGRGKLAALTTEPPFDFLGRFIETIERFLFFRRGVFGFSILMTPFVAPNTWFVGWDLTLLRRSLFLIRRVPLP